MRRHWLIASFLSTFLVAAPAHAGQLTSWRFDANQKRLEFRTDDSVQPKAELLNNPTRLIVDLPGTTFSNPTVTQLLGGAIRSVRVGQLDDNTTRLVIELLPAYTIAPEKVRVRGISPNQWIVQLPTLQQVATLPQQTPPVTGDQVSTPIPVPAPENNNPTGEIPRTRNGRIVVIIDPGHGGYDSGAPGVGGVLEKNIVLSISQKLASLLERQGIQVVLTRNADYFVDLQPRVDIADRAHANLFVSIHANSIDGRPDVNGLETYYYSSGERLAQTVHNSILQNINIHDRGVRQARFYVLRNSSMPSILVETGFVTSPEESAKLTNPDYQDRMATAIARGILLYIQQNL